MSKTQSPSKALHLPLIGIPQLGTKRTRAEISSDDAATSTVAGSSSSPASTHRAPSSDVWTPEKENLKRPKKLPRYSMPSESPTNVFRIAKASFQKQADGDVEEEDVLPEPSNKLLDLRFQLKYYPGVYRCVRVPSTYTFSHLHKLALFLFGWPSEGDRHSWELVKEVRSDPDVPGQIASSKHWATLSAIDLKSSPENENTWTIAKAWGAGGVFTERGAVYVNKVAESTIHITLIKGKTIRCATDYIRVMDGAGAPPCNEGEDMDTWDEEDDVPDLKVFIAESFQHDAFEKWLRGKIVTKLTAWELRAGSLEDFARLKEEAAEESPVDELDNDEGDDDCDAQD